MAIKISAETAAAALDGTEKYLVTQGGNSRAATGAQIKTMVKSGLAAGDVSGLAASATADATNASNIGSGTLPAARIGAASLDLTTKVTGILPIANGGTGDAGGAWSTYTPTVGSSSGTITTASASGRYKKIGRIVLVEIVVTITTNGTGASFVTATLPFTAASAQYILFGRESQSIGKVLQGEIVGSGTVVNIYNYDNSYPGANGYKLVLTGVYESAT